MWFRKKKRSSNSDPVGGFNAWSRPPRTVKVHDGSAWVDLHHIQPATFVGATNGGVPQGNYPIGSFYIDSKNGTTMIMAAQNTWVDVANFQASMFFEPAPGEGPEQGPDFYVIDEEGP